MAGVEDKDIRNRLAEMMAAAGVPHARAALEVLYLMPKGFLDQYIALFDAALRLPGSAAGRMGTDGEVGKANSHAPMPGTAKGLRINSGKDGGGDAPHLGGGAGKKGPGVWTVKSDRAFEFKQGIDKKLRALGREIRQGLADLDSEKGLGKEELGKASRRNTFQCGGCGRIVSDSWKFCAGCGKKIGPAESA